MREGISWEASVSPSLGCCVSAARCILFLIIWLVTGGRHHFWLLPNLTADVGFIDSFRPLYTHDYKGPRASSKKGSDKDDGASGKAQRSDSDKSDSEKKDDEEDDEEEGENKEAARDGVKDAEGADRHSDSDSDRREDEGSQHSNGNDFEMITREELEQHTEEDEEEDDEETQEREEEGGSESNGQTAES